VPELLGKLRNHLPHELALPDEKPIEPIVCLILSGSRSRLIFGLKNRDLRFLDQAVQDLHRGQPESVAHQDRRRVSRHPGNGLRSTRAAIAVGDDPGALVV
jgi:hypothetical protein